MNDHTEYLAFAEKHPKLFQNHPDPSITILLDEDQINAVEASAAEKLAAHGLSAEWARVGIAYQDQYVFLLRDAVRFPNGATGTYVRFVDPDDSAPGVVILPVYNHQILLVRHFRHAPRQWFLEIPRGFGASGLSPEENARRELAEEIGGEAKQFISLGQTRPDTGMMADCVELFYADIASYGDPELGEGIDAIRLVAAGEFERMIRDNEITCGFTLAAYARAKARNLL
ncbi:MAG TPA: NUDIX hydrolase [Ktedonobacterales bacterium]